MTAAAGDVVAISYDPDPGVVVWPGDVLVTRTGRTYLVVHVRRQERGRHVGRLHLTWRRR